MTDQDFVYDGTTYAFSHIRVSSAGGLQISMTAAFSQTALDNLVFHAGSSSFALSDATTSDDETLNWNSAGLSWSDGQTIAISFTEPPTASIGAETDGTGDAEGVEGETIELTVKLSAVSAGAVTGKWRYVSGTARSADYSHDGNQNLTIAAGDTTATISVDLIDDDKYEGEESFEIELYDVVGATIDRSRAQITIDVDSNNPDLPSFQVDPTTVDVNEDNGTVTVQVVHDAFPAQDDDITITYQTADGTATQPDDYTATSGTLTFPARSRATRTVTIPIINDADEEDDETFEVEFGAPSIGAFDSGGAKATVTIEANDPPSADATLSGLTLKNATDDSAIDLNETFASGTNSYTVTVANDVDEITVEPTSDHNATFAYLNASDTALTDADTNTTGFQVALAVGANTVKVKVTAEDGNADDTYIVVVTRAAAGNTLATGKPSITGAAQAGMTLEAGLGDIADADDLPASGYSYQWISGGSAILGAIGSSLTLGTSNYNGQKLRVQVSFTDDAGYPESRTSDETLPVAPSAAACPTDAATVWCATLTVGHELDADNDAIEAGYEARSGQTAYGSVTGGGAFRHLGVDYTVTAMYGVTHEDLYLATTPNLPADGAGLTVHVQTYGDEVDAPLAEAGFIAHSNSWRFVDLLLSSPTDPLADTPLIRGIYTRFARILEPTDLGTKVRVRLSYAAPTGPATGKPEITGTIEVGETLTADTSRIADADGLTSVSYTYQWIRVDGTNESNIAGATGSSYTLVGADEGKGIRVRVSFTDDAGNPETLTSDIYRAVTILPAPRLPSVDDPNAIWMATLTVANLGSSKSGYKGSQGGLTDTAFTYLGDDTPLSGGSYQEVGTLYTIDELSYHTGTGKLVLSLDVAFVGGSAANIFVDVGGTQRSFSQASPASNPYTFTFPNPSWSVGDEVTVKIVVLEEANGPEELAATSAESGDGFDVTLEWDAPASGGAVTGYRVEYQPDPALQWRTLESSQSGTTYDDSGLGRGTVRYYRVAALRSGGASYSEIVRAQAASETQEVPEKVNHVDVKPAAGSDTALEVAWNRPRTPNSAPATGYHVQYAQHDGAAPAVRDGEDWATVTFPRWMERLPWRTWSGVVEEIEFEESTERSPTLKTVVTGLESGTNYRVRVRGCTEAGCGEWSYPRRWTTSGATTLNATEAEPLTAMLEDFPVNHDGSSAFTFRIAFSADVEITPEAMRDHALTVTGGTVTNATQVDGRSDLWELTVEPVGTGPVSILVPQGRACTEPGALCTADGQALSTGLGHSVPGPAPSPQGQQALAPLAAGFVSVPAEHDGQTAFWLELSFDAAVARGSKRHIRALLGATGGSVTRMRRKDGRLDHWRIRIQPSSHEAVTVTLSPSPPCGATGAVCTEDGRTFTTALATRIQGPPGLAVADAEVEEAANATLAFAVTLSRAPSGTVTVDFATSDGTATAGSDYTATSGTLTFAAGETAKTVPVPVLDDDHDEGSETLTLTLSNPSGAYLADGTATGTITNTDHMPQAWIARFGRTVADQVLNAVEERLRSGGTAGMSVSLGGQTIGSAGLKAKSDEESDAASDGKAASLFGATADAGETARVKALSDWLSQKTDEKDRFGNRSSGWSRTVTGRELLMGSSFSLMAQTDGGGFAGLWGRMAQTSFAGREGTLSLDGDVTTGLLGADYASGRWTTGLVLSHSIGEGGYRGETSGEIEATVTAVTPWARYAVTERLSVWGAAGYGAGALKLTAGDDPALKTDLGMTLAAAGARTALIGGDGPKLDAVTDARWVRTTTARVSSAPTSDGGNLASASATVTRLRLGLEGSWPLALGDDVLGKGATVTPRLAIGVRHDGGDAETGFGADIGGGVTLAAPAHGLTVSLEGRGVLTHEAAGLRDRGIAGSLAWDPPPSNGRGPKLTLTQTIGAGASGGKDALLSRTTLEGLAANDNGAGRRRLEARFGYGFSVLGDRFTMSPEIGLGLSEAGRDYSLGWRLTRTGSGPGSLEFSVEARRRESVNDDVPPEHGIGFRLTARY